MVPRGRIAAAAPLPSPSRDSCPDDGGFQTSPIAPRWSDWRRHTPSERSIPLMTTSLWALTARRCASQTWTAARARPSRRRSGRPHPTRCVAGARTLHVLLLLLQRTTLAVDSSRQSCGWRALTVPARMPQASTEGRRESYGGESSKSAGSDIMWCKKCKVAFEPDEQGRCAALGARAKHNTRRRGQGASAIASACAHGVSAARSEATQQHCQWIALFPSRGNRHAGADSGFAA